MIKMLTACTDNIDDADAAVAEVLDQLDLDHNLKKNAVGFITCYPEFIETGVVKALAAKLPFNTIGMTTFACSVTGRVGRLLLTISVLTSDDVAFSSAITNPLNAGNLKTELGSAYDKAARALPGRASLIMVMAPLLMDVSGDDVIREFDALTGGVPVFGGNAASDDPDYKNTDVFHNDICNPADLAMVLFHGEVDFNFSLGSLSSENILSQKAVITASQGNVLIEVNQIPAMEYMQSLGLAADGQMISFSGVPLIVDFNDGTVPVARIVIGVTPEKYIVCGASMPQGATLSIGSMNYDEVLHVSSKVFDEAISRKNRDGIFLFSCLARNSALGLDVEAEMETAEKMLNGRIPSFMTYPSGEFCPVYMADGRTINRFHNDTLVVCQF